MHEERFGVRPGWLAVAPGRVNLIGEHTDYNDGYVLPVAIDRYVAAAASPAVSRADGLRFYSEAMNGTVDLVPGDRASAGDPSWANYLRGVVWGFAARGAIPAAIDVTITSDVPVGGGLASSAALEVATATLLEVVTGEHLDPHEKARLCRRAEHDFAGVPCGVMDQLVSVLGDARGALLIDCRLESSILVPFADPKVDLLIANSNVKHALADGAYVTRRAQCSEAARQLGIPALRDATPAMVEASDALRDPTLRRRARHVTTENARTLAAAGLLASRDYGAAGALMYASHRSLRDDFEVSCMELDALVDIARAIGAEGGVFGARMTGGGFGGCTITLVRSDRTAEVQAVLRREYRILTGRDAGTFVSRPARGAYLVDPVRA